MPPRRPTWLWRPIGDRHACGVRTEFKHIFLIYLFYILFAYLYWNNVRTLIRHVSLRSDMLVSDGSSMGPRWVSDEASQGLGLGLHSGMLVSDGSLMKHLKVSDWVSTQACWSPMGLWLVSDGSPIGL